MNYLTPNEVEGLRTILVKLVEKKTALEIAAIKEVDASTAYKLKEDIADLEQQIQEIKDQLSSAEKTLNNGFASQSSSSGTASIFFDKRTPTEVDRCSCNRDEHFETVKEFFRAQYSAQLLHVFLPAYPDDAPESFVERILYHLFPGNNYYSPNWSETQEGKCLAENELSPVSDVLKVLENEMAKCAQANYPENIVLFFRLDFHSWETYKCQRFIDELCTIIPQVQTSKKFRIFYWLDPIRCPSKLGFFHKYFRANKHSIEPLIETCKDKVQICFLDYLPHAGKQDLKKWLSGLCKPNPSHEIFIEYVFGGSEKVRMGTIEHHLNIQLKKYNTY